MRLTLLPVYSKLAEPELVERVLQGRTLPSNIELRQHQALTLEALEDPNVDIVANTAMTGDGKSLAAYLRLLINPDPEGYNRSSVLGLYPTIELSQDQRQQFKKYQDQFGTQLAFMDLWGTKLTELTEMGFNIRGNALKALLDTHHVVLTNPDIFTRIMNFQYWSGIYTLQELPWTALTHFQLLLFDEFHLFSMPQFVSTVTALLYAQEVAGTHGPKAMFSSATQHASLLELIQRAGLRQRVISGSYKMDPDPQYRQILHEATLHIHQLQGEQNSEAWIREHISLIDEAWRTYEKRTPRAAIIVSSVATARRLTLWLREHFARSPFKSGGLRVEEVTGLMRGSIHDADIVVGTSTIDVGVDFDINLLIFEALNAGQFLQRLGRLARFHVGEETFDAYDAHVLISAKTPWISEQLGIVLRDAGVNDGDAVDRPKTLQQAVERSYPSEADFASYAHRWGALQSCHVIHTLRYKLKDSANAYDQVASALEMRYAKLFGWKSQRPIWSRYQRLSRDEAEGRSLLDEVLSFRGSSPFQIAVLDASQGEVKADNFIAYDLFFVLQATQWELLLKENYFDMLRMLASKDYHPKELELQRVMCDTGGKQVCMRVMGFREERDCLTLELKGRIGEDFIPERPAVLKGFRVLEPRGNGISDVNRALARTAAVAYISEKSVPDLRRLGLPALFPLYRLQVLGTSHLYTVTFGKPALMLDALVRSHRWRERTPLSSETKPIFI